MYSILYIPENYIVNYYDLINSLAYNDKLMKQVFCHSETMLERYDALLSYKPRGMYKTKHKIAALMVIKMIVNRHNKLKDNIDSQIRESHFILIEVDK